MDLTDLEVGSVDFWEAPKGVNIAIKFTVMMKAVRLNLTQRLLPCARTFCYACETFLAGCPWLTGAQGSQKADLEKGDGCCVATADALLL